MSTNTSNNQPVGRVRLGAVQAAIWQNTDRNGVPRYGVTFERIYKDAEGNWQSTGSFGRDELLVLAKVADRAHSEIHELQALDREAARTEAEASSGKPAKAEKSR